MTNYFIFFGLCILINIYTLTCTNTKGNITACFLGLSFVPVLNYISWMINLGYIGENQHVIKNNKFNKFLGL